MSTTTLTASYLHSLRDLIADDSQAASYQSLGQYRAALLRHICEQLVALDEVVDQQLIPLEPAGWRAFMTEVSSFASCLVHGDTLAGKARALLRRRAVFSPAQPAPTADASSMREAA